VRESKHAPHNQVCVKDIIIPVCGISQTTKLYPTLQRMAAGGIEFVILILGHPEVVASEHGAPALCAFGVCDQELCRWRHDLVSDWISSDRVDFGSVLDLEEAVPERVCI